MGSKEELAACYGGRRGREGRDQVGEVRLDQESGSWPEICGVGGYGARGGNQVRIKGGACLTTSKRHQTQQTLQQTLTELYSSHSSCRAVMPDQLGGRAPSRPFSLNTCGRRKSKTVLSWRDVGQLAAPQAPAARQQAVLHVWLPTVREEA
jgi:hypothetical protein